MMSSFSAPTTKFTDLNFLWDTEIPRLEAEKTSAPIIEQKPEVIDINSGSESEFPELPLFKDIFSPITPKKNFQNPYSKLTAHFPLTPETTPARRLKRETSQLGSPSRSRPFKKALQKASSRPLVSRTPLFCKFHELKPKPADAISALEFDRMAEEVMQQVDWKAVSDHVASNRSEGVYKRIIATILKEKVGMLKKSEKERSAFAAELGK